MPFVDNSERQDFDYKLPPEDLYDARIIGIVDLGTHETEFQGKKKTQNPIRVTWELVDTREVFKEGDEPKPFVRSRDFNYSMYEGGHMMKSFLDKLFKGKFSDENQATSEHFKKMLGWPCRVMIEHKKSKDGKKTYAVIENISKAKDKDGVAEAYNSYTFFDTMNPDKEAFDSFPDWLQGKIQSCKEWASIQAMMSGNKVVAESEGDEDDLPF